MLTLKTNSVEMHLIDDAILSMGDMIGPSVASLIRNCGGSYKYLFIETLRNTSSSSDNINKICKKLGFNIEWEFKSNSIYCKNLICLISKENNVICKIIYSGNRIHIISKDLNANLSTLIEKVFDDKYEYSESINLYIPEKIGSNINITKLTISGKSFGNIYPDLYPNIDINMLLSEYMKSDEPILIISGEPGCGKTTFAKYLLRSFCINKNKDFSEDFQESVGAIYTNDNIILNDPLFWNKIVEYNCDESDRVEILLLDDISYSMIRSNTSENRFVNNLLYTSSGIVEPKLKILITTNQKDLEIDPAIIRPGRCFDNIALKPLSPENAEDIWINTFKQDKRYFYDNILKKAPNSHVGFGALSSISHISQANLISHYKCAIAHVSKRLYYK